jgi:hypothetical protein
VPAQRAVQAFHQRAKRRHPSWDQPALLASVARIRENATVPLRAAWRGAKKCSGEFSSPLSTFYHLLSAGTTEPDAIMSLHTLGEWLPSPRSTDNSRPRELIIRGRAQDQQVWRTPCGARTYVASPLSFPSSAWECPSQSSASRLPQKPPPDSIHPRPEVRRTNPGPSRARAQDQQVWRAPCATRTYVETSHPARRRSRRREYPRKETKITWRIPEGGLNP